MAKRRVTPKQFKDLLTSGNDSAKESDLIVCRAQPFELLAQTKEDGDAAGDDGGYVRTFTISTDDVDREGDRILVDGWKLENYLRGGTVLYAHNYQGLPVGKPLKTWTETNALRQRIRFCTRDENPFGHTIGRLVEADILRAASVGFRAIKWEFVEDRGGFMPTNFIEQELLENSIVPVPANPDALADAKGLGIDLAPLVTGFEQIIDEDIDLVVVERDLVKAAWKIIRPDKATVCFTKTAADPAAEPPCSSSVDAAAAPIDPPTDQQEDQTVAVTDTNPDEPVETSVDDAEVSIKTAAEQRDKAVAQIEAMAAKLGNVVTLFVETFGKAGRVISSANEGKLREARDLLSHVISQVESEDDADDGKHFILDLVDADDGGGLFEIDGFEDVEALERALGEGVGRALEGQLRQITGRLD